MKTKLVALGLLLSITSVGASAQKKPSGKPDFMKEMIFSQFKNIFHSEKLVATSRTNYIFPWERTAMLDKANLSVSLDTVAKNFSCTTSNNEIKIESKFPANIKIEASLFSINVIDYKLKNEQGQVVELNTDMNFVGFGNEFTSSFETDSLGNTESREQNTITVNRTISLKTNADKLVGSITVEGKLIVGYDYKKITKSDIGNEIVFNSQKFKVLAISKGNAVLKTIEGNGEFDYLVTGGNNLPYNGMTAKSQMAQQDYDYFSTLSPFTMTEFSPYYEKNKERLLSKGLNRDIIIIKCDGEIENLYIYVTNDFITKKVELKMQL